MYSFVIIVIQFHSMFLIVNFISEHMVSFLILWEFLIPEQLLLSCCSLYVYEFVTGKSHRIPLLCVRIEN